MMQPSALILVLFGGMVGLGCSTPERPASSASSVNSPSNTGPDITTGPGAGEPTDVSPETGQTTTDPGRNDSRSTGSSGPEMGPSNASPSASPVH